MDVYLVGGAVRDHLLGRPVRERDWVVVGSSPEAMLEAGYRQVGRDFPVFLHPTSKEEYALARTERKTAPGHGGFVCHTGPDVSLEDDLQRRDLTINAMAETADGSVIDPFGGQADLNARLLRHVSGAFSEDPLRVFRVARFAAQLEGFAVAEETLELMQAMALGGELAELSAERVWQELQRALAGVAPLRFFAVLRACNALLPWLPEFADLEIRLPASLEDPRQRFAALAWVLAPVEVEALCARLKAPKAYARDAALVAGHGALLAAWQAADAQDVYASLKSAGAFRSNSDHARWLPVVGACAGLDLQPLGDAIERIARRVNTADLPAELSGKAVGEALDAERIEALRQAQIELSRASG